MNIISVSLFSFISIISFFSFVASFSAYTNEALNDQVTSLTGLNYVPNFNQFSGYLNVPDTGKHIHYWFTESEVNPETAPLVFWTNGGPGCSGLIGFLTEQGPFYPDENLELHPNEWAWNKIVNMVFLEQPVGVGFSWTDNSDELRIGDDQAAADNLQTVLQFLERFPHLKKVPLYITSESYGGHYIPQLALKIIEYNEDKNNNNNPIFFKGLAVGNPYVDYYSGIGAQMETYYNKQLLPLPLWEKYVGEGCLEPANLVNNSACSTYALEFMKKIGNLNPYALDYPVCVSETQKFFMNYLTSNNNNIFASTNYNPCVDNYMTEYLNQDEVKKQLHVNLDIEWEECSRTTKYELKDKMLSTVHLYKKILESRSAPDLNMMIYYGDDDGVCGLNYGQKWIFGLGYSYSSLWKVWEVDGQTAGYITKFRTPSSLRSERLTFATVHYAGHEVPTYKPKEAFTLFQAFINF